MWEKQWRRSESINGDTPCKRSRHGRADIRIGEYPAIGVEEARKTALQYRADVDRSVDPKAEKQKKDEELTFAQFANEYYLPHAEIYK
ncbi:integrase arm-type DNA-binding domain-containing protein [Cupriavidus metallidurans]|uniref:integrase arm-type DNA-binding domain-containing protein n=1 Tax=Cupriavidus metallidurans TaxID=119219 RepID=UPI0009B834A3